MITKYYEDTSDANSRYRRLRRIRFDDGSTKIETANKISLPESNGDAFYTVTPEDAHRLDLISHKMYGTPLFWWVIAEASDIKDPFTVPVGTVLRIPEPSTLYSLEGVLSNA